MRHSDKALNHLTFTRSTRKPLWGWWECFRAEVDAAYDQFLNLLPLQDRDAWRV